MCRPGYRSTGAIGAGNAQIFVGFILTCHLMLCYRLFRLLCSILTVQSGVGGGEAKSAAPQPSSSISDSPALALGSVKRSRTRNLQLTDTVHAHAQVNAKHNGNSCNELINTFQVPHSMLVEAPHTYQHAPQTTYVQPQEVVLHVL